MTTDRVYDPAATDGFLGFCQIYNLLVSAAKEKEVLNYEFVEGKEKVVRAAIELAIKHGPGNPPREIWGAARLVKHIPYVNTANTAFVEAKDVTRVPPSTDDHTSIQGEPTFNGQWLQMNYCSVCTKGMIVVEGLKWQTTRRQELWDQIKLPMLHPQLDVDI